MSNVNKAKRDELLDDLLKWMKDTDAKIYTSINQSFAFRRAGFFPCRSILIFHRHLPAN